MARKTRRSIYDPNLEILESAGYRDDAFDEEDGVQAAENEDPLCRYEYSPDFDEEEYQQTEFLDPKLHGLSRKRSRWQTLCFGMASLVMVGSVIAILVAVPIVVTNNKKGNSAALETEKSSISLPPPPADLPSRCALEKGKTESSVVPCLEVCEIAECCDLPPEYRLSCLEGNEYTCFDYHRAGCNVLSLDPEQAETPPTEDYGDDVKPAPDSLFEMCSFSNLQTDEGKSACLQHCGPASCCFAKGVVSCSNNAVCSGYVPCLNWRASQNYDSYGKEEGDVQDSNVEEKDDSQGNGNEGKGGQEEGDGKTGPETGSVPGTSETNELASNGDNQTSSQVNAGDAPLISNQTIVEFQPAPEGLAKKCSLYHFERWGKNKCRQACAEASCCFAEGSAPCPNQIYCKSYAPCLNVSKKRRGSLRSVR